MSVQLDDPAPNSEADTYDEWMEPRAPGRTTYTLPAATARPRPSSSG